MEMVADFLVKKDDLHVCRVTDAESRDLEDGEALLRVEAFGLSSNNVTYAVLGEMMSYWEFFPAEEGWGRIPTWGFAEVERSAADGVEQGTRVYGYLPPSSHLVVTPVSAGERGFTDGSAHRQALPSAYQQLLTTDVDPFYRDGTEDLQMLLRPLFFTAFLIDDQLADDGFTARGPIVISSASSKTAIATAFMLAKRDEVSLVGLTSSRNAEFVAGLGVYDRTVTYESIDSLERGPATYVDIAGDGSVRHRVHSHFGDQLAHSMTVGLTHWEEMGGGEGDLPGPDPAFFFAPDRVAKRATDWGAAGLEARVAEAWHPFCEWAGGWLEVVRGRGLDAARDAYLEVLGGRVPPQAAHVISP